MNNFGILGRVVGSVVLALGTASAALGQADASARTAHPAVDIDRVTRLIADLDHDRYQVREEATRELLQTGAAARPALLRALRDGKVGPEGGRRLQQVVDALIGFQTFEPLPDVKDAWNRLGSTSSLFVIDNAWDLARYRRLMPKLPEVDLATHLLVVAVSWDSSQCAFASSTIDGEALVIRVEEKIDQREFRTAEFIPPKYVVARVAAWPGPIRFDVNGKPRRTRLTGKELDEAADRQWREIERLYDNDKPTHAQRIAAHRQYWGAGTGDALIEADLKTRPAVSRHEMKAIFDNEFNRLGEMRARSVADKIFRRAERMREHDPAYDGAHRALTAIGGPEVVAGCARALESKNVVAQCLAIDVLRDLGLPEFRKLYHRALACPDARLVRGGLDGLEKLGWRAEDVPALVAVLKRPVTDRDGDVLKSTMYVLADLGRDAATALPELEKLRVHSEPYIRKAADAATDRLKAAIREPGR